MQKGIIIILEEYHIETSKLHISDMKVHSNISWGKF